MLAGLIAAAIFMSTLQTQINGAQGYYTTDVGEIQNAFPRWGTLHPTGYPLYSILGSSWVSVLRVIGIEPAAGASLVSLLWGAIAVGLLAQLAIELNATPSGALIGALFFAVSRSMWMDSSIAEVHTMTMVFTIAALLFAVRFGRSGNRKQLWWLAAVLSNGIVHNRSVVFMLPAVLVLIGAQWRIILPNIPKIIGLGFIAILLYLYLPLREAMGEEWIFFQKTTTWDGFWDMIFHTKTEIVTIPNDWPEWKTRLTETWQLMTDDLVAPLLLAGLGGLFAIRRNEAVNWRTAVGLFLAWFPFALLCLVIWEERRVSDSLLAVKLPLSMVAGLGLALLITRLQRWKPRFRSIVLVAAGLALVWTEWIHYPKITEITHDRSIEATITLANRAANPGQPIALLSLWGNSYWALAYAQDYRGQLEGIRLVNDRDDLSQLLAEDYQLVVLREVFYHYSLSYWEERVGDVLYPDSYAPDLIELLTAPRFATESVDEFVVNGDLSIVAADVQHTENNGFLVTIHWQAKDAPSRDYRIAAHLLATDPPTGPQDILSQDDEIHPVEGLYPTSEWREGQVVQSIYLLLPPAETQSIAVRITAYYLNEAGEFVNGNWFTLPVD